MNMGKLKYSHPSKDEIGQLSESTDINPAFAQHYYLSKAVGEKGPMIRAFVPIMNSENIQQMFGLEPHEISKMYVERTETFNAMHEGIIAVDSKLNITIFNNTAAEILGIKENPANLIGKNIFDVLPDSRLPDIVLPEGSDYNQEIYINQRSILNNRVPIHVDGKRVGTVAVFKDLTAIKQLAEELTGVKAFVQALRVHTHEYKNKLHTIAGLLHLGHTKQALEYISQVSDEHDNITKFLNERIYNENISGLLLSKISRGKELEIKYYLET
ncbi:hypothetical protein RhiirA1_481896 [Rhizophagus irregularis]|uniref:PAS domain-containing protein n=1 Tax=Rhizophagus irregularis TaxID=588596 RepID=A0A2N0QMI9_9GLOM|nr:hypothetical protein RhiirA1_481896 [Rhizophagus irregularis]